MPETIEITYIRNAIDSIRERLDTIEKKLKIGAEQAMIEDNTLGIGELDRKE